jgi:hypothetical protein
MRATAPKTPTPRCEMSAVVALPWMAPQTISSLSWLTVKQVMPRATPGGGAAA